MSARRKEHSTGSAAPAVLLLGTLDTKGAECAYLRQCLLDCGCEVVVADCGIQGTPDLAADVTREQVAEAAGTSIAALTAAGDRGAAVSAMARGITSIVSRLVADERVAGFLGVGGSGGSALIAEAMRELPLGVPKLLVSTVASGDTRPYVGASDIAMLHSVVDMAGVNRISAPILANAAAAIAGMVRFALALQSHGDVRNARPMVAASMFGVTTPCVMEAKRLLEASGYEVLVFHAVGTGGEAMEALAAQGILAGVLDVTTTELADDLVGGVLSAGPNRLEAAAIAGVPQIVCPGALDMVNFGPREMVPQQFREGRKLYEHNASVTLMRTTPEECAELGKRIARKMNMSSGPAAIFIPLRGVSLLSTEGNAFYDDTADRALFDAIRSHISDAVEVHELDLEINDPRFARAIATRMLDMLGDDALSTGDEVNTMKG